MSQANGLTKSWIGAFPRSVYDAKTLSAHTSSGWEVTCLMNNQTETSVIPHEQEKESNPRGNFLNWEMNLVLQGEFSDLKDKIL